MDYPKPQNAEEKGYQVPGEKVFAQYLSINGPALRMLIDPAIV